MRRRVFLATIAAAALALGLLAPNSVSAAPTEAPADPVASTAVAAWASCISVKKTGNVLILVDQSRSLADTDRSQSRVSAGLSVLDRLVSIYSEARDLNFNAQVAGFASDIAPGMWTPLNASTVGTLNSRVIELGADARYEETDYYHALYGALRQFETAPSTDCRAIFWLSDGMFDLTTNANASGFPPPLGRAGQPTKDYDPEQVILDTNQKVDALEAAAQKSMCAPGGLVGDVRRAGIRVFGIGFHNDPGYSFDFMRALVEGGPYLGSPCGPTVAGMTPPGTFTTGNADIIIDALGGLIPGTDTHVALCPAIDDGSPADRCGVTFGLHEWFDRVNLQASVNSSSVSEFQVFVTAPSGARVELTNPGQGTPAESAIGGVGLRWTWWSSGSVNLDLIDSEATGSADDWAGAWTLQLYGQVKDPAVECLPDDSASWPNCGYVSLYFNADVEPVLTLTDIDSGHAVVVANEAQSGQAVHANRNMEAAYAVRSEQGTLVTRLPEGVKGTLCVTYTYPSTIQEFCPTTFGRQQFVVPASDQGVLEIGLRLNLSILLERAGESISTAFQPVETGVTIPIRPASGYPEIDLTPIDVGELNDDNEFSVTTTIRATLEPGEAGCVWLPAGQEWPVEGIEGISATSVYDSRNTCLTVPGGGTVDLPVTLTAAKEGTALTFSGTLTVQAAPGETDDPPQSASVPFVGSARHMNSVVRNVTAFGFALLGVLLPCGIWWLFKRSRAVIPSDNGLTASKWRVQVDHSQVLCDGRPLEARSEAGSNHVPLLGIPPRCRSLEVLGVSLRATAGGLWGAARVKATLPGSYVAAGSGEWKGATLGGDHHGQLPLAVHNSWLVVAQPGTPVNEATIIVLANAGRKGAIDDILRDIRERAPRIIADLQGAIQRSGTKAPATPPTGPLGEPGPTGGGPGPGPIPSPPSPFPSPPSPFPSPPSPFPSPPSPFANGQASAVGPQPPAPHHPYR
ncbi:MAG: hypothetical protein LBN10_08720 [Propionibacteriaceae bacterium]|jgi:hypothetical protein|nr:hypothetical protein [Propionibacteriaceae bacterium]